MKQMLNNQLRRFESGVFFFPGLDAETVPLTEDGVPPTTKVARSGWIER